MIVGLSSTDSMRHSSPVRSREAQISGSELVLDGSLFAPSDADNTTNAENTIPAVAIAIEKDDVRLQVSRPGKDFTNVSLFEVLKKIEKL